MVANKGIALHSADAVTNRMQQLNFEKECVAWYHLLTELHFVDAHEVLSLIHI